MTLSERELWTVIHGMGFGAVFLLAFAGGVAGLYSLRPAWLTVEGVEERLFRLKLGMWVTAAVAWSTVITGTWIVYPWYRATPPQGTTDLAAYPRRLLLSRPETSLWHTFGMEWKEHVAWIAPIMATVAAFLVSYYGVQLAEQPRVRRAVMVLFVVAFSTAAVAGIYGAFINKIAPIR